MSAHVKIGEKLTKLARRASQRIADDFIKEATAAGAPAETASGVLASGQIPEGVTGGLKKAWNIYRRRIGDFAAAEKAFEGFAQTHASRAWCPPFRCCPGH